MARALSVTALALLAAGALSAQPAALPLRGVDVFGTRAFTGAELRAQHGTALDSVVYALTTGDYDSTVVEKYRTIMRGLQARGSFAYLDMSLIQYFDDDKRGAYITIDVVERADSAARMAFLPPRTDTVADPGGLVADFHAHVLVDRAEVVDVQVQQHQRRAVRIRGVDHPLQVGFAGAEAGQAGQVGVLGVQAVSVGVTGAGA